MKKLTAMSTTLIIAGVVMGGNVTTGKAEDVKIDVYGEYFNATAQIMKYVGAQYNVSNGQPIIDNSDYEFIGIPDSGFMSMSNLQNNFVDLKVEQDGEPTVSDPNSLYVGEGDLENNTDIVQPMSTPSFSQVYNSTVTSAMTNAFGISTSVSTSFNIPLIGQTSFSLTANYNFSETDTNSSSTTTTYSIPSQVYQVPPHTTYHYKVVLNTMKISGKVIASMLPGPVYETYSAAGKYYSPNNQDSGEFAGEGYTLLNFGDTSEEFSKNYGEYMVKAGVNSPYIDENGRVTTEGTYTADYGTTMDMSISEKSKEAKDTTGATEKIIGTYQINPKVTKE